MPPGSQSRYLFADTVVLDGKRYLGARDPIAFAPDAAWKSTTAQRGDTLHALADRHFGGLDNPAELWWVVAEGQPEPVVDPTIPLAPGRVVFLAPRDRTSSAVSDPVARTRRIL